MTLNAESLEVLEYLRSTPGQFVPYIEISRRAGGRQRFKDNPHWPKAWLSNLVDADLVEVNEHGRYRAKGIQTKQPAPKPVAIAIAGPQATVVGDDYFPAPERRKVVGDDYFPSA
jgi:hypothetical protein